MKQPVVHPAVPLAAIAALWVPVYLAAAYAWRNGDYYDYGWFVPPAGLLLLARRWRETREPFVPPPAKWLMAAVALLFPVFLVLRVLSYADPSWRLPMVLLGLTAAGATHVFIGATRGWKTSARFGLVTLFLLSAVPWPSVAEQQIVRTLTAGVVATVAEVFQLVGKPVEVLGDRLRLHDQTVEVTDGCSGVRSFQSFLMATWFFAELQRLRWRQTLLLLGCACGLAFVVNAGRTYALAHIRFTRGEAAFDQAHDTLGLLAFAVTAVLFYLISGLLSPDRPRRTVRIRRAAATSA